MVAQPIPDRPILGVDIDGVLNLREAPAEHCLVAAETFTLPDGTPMPYPVGTAGRLARLSGSFEMVWASSWGDRAHDVLGEIFGLEQPWRIIDVWWGLHRAALTWKLPAVERWLAQLAAFGSFPPFAWLDDDIDEDAYAWSTHRSRVSPTLVIRVDPRTGLTDDHITELLDWANGL
jgi:hypothetical protein